MTNKEALDLCIALGIGVKSHSSSIEDAQADRARRRADQEGLRRAVAPEEPAPAAAPEPAVRSGRPQPIGEPGGRPASSHGPTGVESTAAAQATEHPRLVR